MAMETFTNILPIGFLVTLVIRNMCQHLYDAPCSDEDLRCAWHALFQCKLEKRQKEGNDELASIRIYIAQSGDTRAITYLCSLIQNYFMLINPSSKLCMVMGCPTMSVKWCETFFANA